MSDLWDFSTLISSFHMDHILNDTNVKYEQIADEMKNQLDKINEGLSQIDNIDLTNSAKSSLLSSPAEFPVSSPSLSPMNTFNISDNNKKIKLTLRDQLQDNDQEQLDTLQKNKVITPPSYPRSAPRNNSRTKSKFISSSTSKAARSSKEQDSISDRTKVFSTHAKLPPLSNKSKSILENNKPIFKVTPNEINFSNFILSKEYKFRFTLQNVSSHTHRFQIQSPLDPAFDFHILDKINTSLIRPGLQITFEITFKPTEPRDYIYDFVITSGENITQDSSLMNNNCDSSDVNNSTTIVHINCCRDPPELELPDVVDLRSTLVHSTKSGSFTITNHGGSAFFSFKSLTGREESLMFSDGSFTLTPSQFQLSKEESIEITIKFNPRYIGKQLSSFEIVPQHFTQRFYFIAQGNSVTPNLKFTICQDKKFLFVPFLPSDNNSSKEIEIFNDSDLSFPFHIQVLKTIKQSKTILNHLYSDIILSSDNESEKSTSQPFNIVPLSGQISPKEIVKVKISYLPSCYGFSRSNLVIFADRIPDVTGTLKSKKMLSISLEAYSGMPRFCIQPNLIIFNSVVPTITSKEMIEIINDSYLKIKLNWPHNEVINSQYQNLNSLPSFLMPQSKKNIELSCVISKQHHYLPQPSVWKLFRRYPNAAKKLENQIMSQSLDINQNINNKSDSKLICVSPNCVSFEPNKDDVFQVAPNLLSENSYFTNTDRTNEITFRNNFEEQTLDTIDEMPNIFSPKTISDSSKTNEIFSLTNCQSEVLNNTQIDHDILPKFKYIAHLSKPELNIHPQTLDFGFILAGETGTQILNLTNQSSCPICYQIEFCVTNDESANKIDTYIKNENDAISNDKSSQLDEGENEITIEKCNGVVEANESLPIEVNLNVKKIKKIVRYIKIKSWWWASETDTVFSAPSFENDVKILACIDRPLLRFKERVINIGSVYPTLKYSAFFEGNLMNSFPTPFFIDDFASTVSFKRNIITNKKKLINNHVTESLNNRPKSVSNATNNSLKSAQEEDMNILGTIKGVHSNRSSTVITDYNKNNEDDGNNFLNNQIEIQQGTLTEPKEGSLEIGDSINLNVSVTFAELGDQALPMAVNIKGNRYTCLIVAHVDPPKITLLTEKVDFSDDFIICRRSKSQISVKNECGIASSIRLEVNDDCHNVFQLHDPTTHHISPNETIDIPISCYSEIHGDFYGSFKLIIHDLWQTKEVLIPLHVKAQRSFFGFLTHALGYTKWGSQASKNDVIYSIFNSYKYGQMTGIEGLDFIYFGVCPSRNEQTNENKEIRRLFVENYSSEPIFIDWELSNLVKGRKYVDLSMNIEDDGYVKLNFEENEESKLMQPFNVLSKRTKVNPHDKSLVIIEFTNQSNPGTYRGILSARCGEFTHKLGLVAICE